MVNGCRACCCLGIPMMLGDDRLGLPILPLLPPPPPRSPPPIPPDCPVGPPTCWLWLSTLRLLMGSIPLQEEVCGLKKKQRHWQRVLIMRAHSVRGTCWVRGACASSRHWAYWRADRQTGSARCDSMEELHCCSCLAWETPMHLQREQADKREKRGWLSHVFSEITSQ